ncbi:DNA recombination protein RmuC [bacterium]|nr:DNA recombination protein RmuC [bacterium]
MNYVIFLLGFVIGAVLTFVVQTFVSNGLYQKMKTEFENISLTIIKDSKDDVKKENKDHLDEILGEFKEKIEKFEKNNKEQYEEEKIKLETFETNIKNIKDTGDLISREATSLKNVLKADNRSIGQWGELVLDRVFEASGLRKDEEYKLQTSEFSEKGKPDATVLLPEGKLIFVDAKTSFASWYDYMKAPDEEKETLLKAFKQSLKSHIDGLKNKYEAEKAFKYVMMFIPIESCYSLVFCDDCEIWDYAWKNDVMPVSPTTLLASLKIVNSIMELERQNKNAQDIAKACTSFLDKIISFREDLIKIKTGLDSAFTKLDGKGNMINQIQKIQKLGATTNKEIKQIAFEEAEE